MDIDFDELDRAVNSLMEQQSKQAAKKTAAQSAPTTDAAVPNVGADDSVADSSTSDVTNTTANATESADAAAAQSAMPEAPEQSDSPVQSVVQTATSGTPGDDAVDAVDVAKKADLAGSSAGFEAGEAAAAEASDDIAIGTDDIVVNSTEQAATDSTDQATTSVPPTLDELTMPTPMPNYAAGTTDDTASTAAGLVSQSTTEPASQAESATTNSPVETTDTEATEVPVTSYRPSTDPASFVTPSDTSTAAIDQAAATDDEYRGPVGQSIAVTIGDDDQELAASSAIELNEQPTESNQADGAVATTDAESTDEEQAPADPFALAGDIDTAIETAEAMQAASPSAYPDEELPSFSEMALEPEADTDTESASSENLSQSEIDQSASVFESVIQPVSDTAEPAELAGELIATTETTKTTDPTETESVFAPIEPIDTPERAEAIEVNYAVESPAAEVQPVTTEQEDARAAAIETAETTGFVGDSLADDRADDDTDAIQVITGRTRSTEEAPTDDAQSMTGDSAVDSTEAVAKAHQPDYHDQSHDTNPDVATDPTEGAPSTATVPSVIITRRPSGRFFMDVVPPTATARHKHSLLPAHRPGVMLTPLSTDSVDSAETAETATADTAPGTYDTPGDAPRHDEPASQPQANQPSETTAWPTVVGSESGHQSADDSDHAPDTDTTPTDQLHNTPKETGDSIAVLHRPRTVIEPLSHHAWPTSPAAVADDQPTTIDVTTNDVDQSEAIAVDYTMPTEADLQRLDQIEQQEPDEAATADTEASQDEFVTYFFPPQPPEVPESLAVPQQTYQAPGSTPGGGDVSGQFNGSAGRYTAAVDHMPPPEPIYHAASTHPAAALDHGHKNGWGTLMLVLLFSVIGISCGAAAYMYLIK